MMKKISELLLKLLGWKIHDANLDEIPKAVLVVAPHTSWFDFLIGRLAFYKYGLPVRFLIKKEMFWFPLGPILKLLGAIPIERAYSAKTIGKITEIFQKSDRMYLAITPEGTRKLNKNWKRGFYYISQKANVPMVLAYVDYKKKEGGVGPIFHPSGDYEEDLRKIQKFYENITARYPENFNLSALYRTPEAENKK